MFGIYNYLKDNFSFSGKKARKYLGAGLAIILSIVTLGTSLKYIFKVDILDTINNSLDKKRFAEAYGSSCGFSDNYETASADLDFSSGFTGINVNSSAAIPLPFDFYYTGKKFNSINLDSQLFNLSNSEQNFLSSLFSFDGLGINSKKYFTDDVVSSAYSNGNTYNWNLGLPVNTTNNLKINDIKTKTFGSSPNRIFGGELSVSPSEAGPGKVDRLTPNDASFNSATYTSLPASIWSWNYNVVITDGQPVSVYVLEDKGDINLDSISITAVTTNGTKGNAVKDVSGKKITYTPNPGETGDDTFTYSYTDGNGNSNTETITVKLGSITGNTATVDGLNYTTVELHTDVVTVNSNENTLTFDPLQNDILNQSRSNYSLTLFTGSNYTGDGSNTLVNTAVINSDKTITVNTADLEGIYSLKYEIFDGQTFKDAEIKFVHLPNNNIQQGFVLRENDGNFSTYTRVNSLNSIAYSQKFKAFSKGLGYNPFYLTTEYSLESSISDTNLNRMHFAAQANCAPEAGTDNTSVTSGSFVDVPVLNNDADFEYYQSNSDSPLTVTINSSPSAGTATVNPDNTIKYTPTSGSSTSDYFTYRISDTARYGQSAKDSVGNVYVTIIPAVNQPPTAIADPTTTLKNTPFTKDIVANDTDIEDANNLLTICTGSLSATGGTVTIATDNRSITFTPTNNSTTPGSFTYKTCDSQGLESLPVTSIAIITETNQPPTAIADPTTTLKNTPFTKDIVANDTDIEDANNLLTICTGSLSATGGTVTIATDNRSITFTPTNNSTTPGSFTYKTCDSQGLESLPVTSIATITETNQPPTAIADPTTTLKNTPFTKDIVANDTDIEDANNLLTICTGSLSATGGTVTIATDNRSITFTPTNNSTTPGSFTYKTCDSQGLESLPVTSIATITAPVVTPTPVVTTTTPTPVVVTKTPEVAPAPIQTIQLALKKDTPDSQIQTGTVFKTQADTTNPNPVKVFNVKTIITLDTSRLSLIKDSPKEGIIAFNLNQNNSIYSIFKPVIVEAQSQTATIKILSDNQIEVTYASMEANETKSITFETQSKVKGNTEITGTTQIGDTGPKADAVLPILVEEPVMYTLARTGGREIAWAIGIASVVGGVALFLNLKRKDIWKG